MKKWFRNWIKEFLYPSDEKLAIAATTSSRVIRDHRGLCFNIFQASGGFVVEVVQLIDCSGPMKHSEEKTLFIVPGDADLATELSHILMLEKLRG